MLGFTSKEAGDALGVTDATIRSLTRHGRDAFRKVMESTMPRITDALERESRSVDLEPGDFERLLARRERQQRNRQIRAGVAAAIVALATAALLGRSMIGSEPRPANPAPTVELPTDPECGSASRSRTVLRDVSTTVVS